MHTEEIRAQAMRAGIPKEKTALIPFGIEEPGFMPDAYAARNTLELPHDRRILLFIGVIRPEKGLHDILPLLDALPDNITLLVAGVGADAFIRSRFPECIAQTQRLRIADGYVPSDLFPFYFSACDAVLVTHWSAFAGSSGVMMDAVRFLRPIISLENGHTAQMIHRYGIGRTFHAGDRDSFRDAAMTVTDPQWQEKTGVKEKLRQFRNSHTWDALIPKYVTLYASLKNQTV